MNAPFKPHRLSKVLHVDVVEAGERPRRGRQPCVIGENLNFDPAKLESYFFKAWNPTLYDALLVAAAVEYCDMSCRRLAYQWARDIHLQIPVHDPDVWNSPDTLDALHDALTFLTGDRWKIGFVRRKHREGQPRQGLFSLPSGTLAVLPFSNGLDSCSVAELSGREMKSHELVRIRLGPASKDRKRCAKRGEPFASVPFTVSGPRKEPSMRSRAFKFGIVSALAAHLAETNRIILPESGQGALGPTLVTLGQIYPDYRTHPLFLRKFERLVGALLKRPLAYELPRLWSTKGETLRAYLDGNQGDAQAWKGTVSCWQQNRHSAVNKKARQCGICAACLLRRLSVNAAGQTEPADTYVWENLSASTFEQGASPNFDRKKITGAMRAYAIAGTLHLDHLAAFRTSATNRTELNLNVFQLARACGLAESETCSRLDRLLSKHEDEWRAFLTALGPNSFLRQWASAQ